MSSPMEPARRAFSASRTALLGKNDRLFAGGCPRSAPRVTSLSGHAADLEALFVFRHEAGREFRRALRDLELLVGELQVTEGRMTTLVIVSMTVWRNCQSAMLRVGLRHAARCSGWQPKQQSSRSNGCVTLTPPKVE